MSQEMRQHVQSLVVIQNDDDAHDLSDETLTQTDLIALLQRACDTLDNGGLNHYLLLTSVNTSHGPEDPTWLHGHKKGFAVDCWPIKDADLYQFVYDMIEKNKWVTKVGLGGEAQQIGFHEGTADNGTIVFFDNRQDHVHLQTQ